jgi:hypothetical protein
MPYIFIIIFIAGFGSGYFTSHKIDKAEIVQITNSIAMQNREAELTLATLTEEADKANAKALQLNKELEDANVSTINAINTQRDSFKSQRLYDNGRKGSSCTTAKVGDSNATASADENRYELSNELTEFLKSEAYRADQIATYALMCQNFIIGLNRDRP